MCMGMDKVPLKRPPDKETIEHEATAISIMKGAAVAMCPKNSFAIELLEQDAKTRVPIKRLKGLKFLEDQL